MKNKISDIQLAGFQSDVELYLKRNKNLLDSVSKHQSASSRVSRAIIKAATQCGCITIEGKPQENKDEPTAMIHGTLCKNCRKAIEKEMGDELFYIAALCSSLDLSLFDVIVEERERLELLGQFSLK